MATVHVLSLELKARSIRIWQVVGVYSNLSFARSAGRGYQRYGYTPVAKWEVTSYEITSLLLDSINDMGTPIRNHDTKDNEDEDIARHLHAPVMGE